MVSKIFIFQSVALVFIAIIAVSQDEFFGGQGKVTQVGAVRVMEFFKRIFNKTRGYETTKFLNDTYQSGDEGRFIRADFDDAAIRLRINRKLEDIEAWKQKIFCKFDQNGALCRKNDTSAKSVDGFEKFKKFKKQLKKIKEKPSYKNKSLNSTTQQPGSTSTLSDNFDNNSTNPYETTLSTSPPLGTSRTTVARMPSTTVESSSSVTEKSQSTTSFPSTSANATTTSPTTRRFTTSPSTTARSTTAGSTTSTSTTSPETSKTVTTSSGLDTSQPSTITTLRPVSSRSPFTSSQTSASTFGFSRTTPTVTTRRTTVSLPSTTQRAETISTTLTPSTSLRPTGIRTSTFQTTPSTVFTTPIVSPTTTTISRRSTTPSSGNTSNTTIRPTTTSRQPQSSTTSSTETFNPSNFSQSLGNILPTQPEVPPFSGSTIDVTSQPSTPNTINLPTQNFNGIINGSRFGINPSSNETIDQTSGSRPIVIQTTILPTTRQTTRLPSIITTPTPASSSSALPSLRPSSESGLEGLPTSITQISPNFPSNGTIVSEMTPTIGQRLNGTTPSSSLTTFTLVV